ncbi:flagellar hook-associated protein FlgK [Cellvibrio sp. ARAG 10.3]|uniref:flagellar hook-associated protein FlgK n=1 Tax=Cellvibrio sp. ARAG 10.3 TaxID=3451358 RepID=UPI003F44EF27
MSGLLSTAVSGLQASQNALRTAGHNISNANTAGFSRQQVNYVTRPEYGIGAAGYLGNGVTTESIERVVNEFTITQLRLDTSAFHQLDKYNTNIGQVDKLFADEGTGLSGSLQSFFAALQNGADDPSSIPARQLVISQADSLSARFNNLHNRLKAIESGVNQEIKAVTAQMTALAQSIANLNQAINDKGAGGQGSPNDLLDQRDEALRKLSELTSIQVVKQNDGNVNVFIGNGQPLVVGQKVSKFDVRDGGQIYLTNGVQTADVTQQITGGKLGGLLQFREDVLNPAMNELGRVAIVLADQFNQLQQQGLDMDGDYGQLLFGDINTREAMTDRIKHGRNALPDDRRLSLSIDNPALLTNSDYSFQIVPNTNNYIVTRAADDKIVSQGMLTGAYPLKISFDGLTLNLEGGSFQGGDSFTLQPTINGARDIKTQLTRPEDLAFAVAVRTGTSSGNTGSGVISSGEVLGLVDSNGNTLPAFANAGQLSPPVIIRFTSATTYDVLDNSDPANPKHLNPPMRDQVFIPGVDNPVFSTDVGETRVMGDGGRTGLPSGRTPANLPIGSLVGQVNAYPAEQYTFVMTNPVTGAVSSQVVTTQANASAAQTAAMLSNISGVSANAMTTAAISDININDFSAPLQISVNGVDLLQYTAGAPDISIPDPTVPGNLAAFNDYLAEQINGNADLASLGIRAVSGSNPITGAPELQMVASSGVNLDIRFTATTAGNSIGVHDSNGNPTITLAESTAGNQSAITVGGRIDITMADGVKLRTSPTNSQLLGDSTAADFAQSSYLGYQVTIKGQPQAGDTFTIGFNSNASNDNRNALRFVELETKGTIENGALSLSGGYSRLVETVGTKSNLSSINTSASKSLLEQTQTLRDSVSGVNLDEEAADLIKFEQMYNANARVISVARDLFDTLLNSV